MFTPPPSFFKGGGGGVPKLQKSFMINVLAISGVRWYGAVGGAVWCVSLFLVFCIVQAEIYRFLYTYPYLYRYQYRYPICFQFLPIIYRYCHGYRYPPYTDTVCVCPCFSYQSQYRVLVSVLVYQFFLGIGQTLVIAFRSAPASF